MAVLTVTKLGNPVLRKAAEAVPKESVGTAKFKRLVADMAATMHACEGVGIAAPQVDVSWQLALIEVKADARTERPIPLTALINPKIMAASKTLLEDWEGCLSINDLRGQVPRAEWVEVEMLNQKGEKISFRAEGFFARVIQHECDHLMGKLFIDRMTHLKTLCHLQEFVRFCRD